MYQCLRGEHAYLLLFATRTNCGNSISVGVIYVDRTHSHTHTHTDARAFVGQSDAFACHRTCGVRGNLRAKTTRNDYVGIYMLIHTGFGVFGCTFVNTQYAPHPLLDAHTSCVCEDLIFNRNTLAHPVLGGGDVSHSAIWRGATVYAAARLPLSSRAARTCDQLVLVGPRDKTSRIADLRSDQSIINAEHDTIELRAHCAAAVGRRLADRHGPR